MERKLTEEQIMRKIDSLRKQKDFLSVEEVLLLAERNSILDPFSLLISRDVSIGEENNFYPNVVVENQKGTIKIGNENNFYPGTVLSTVKGAIQIGNSNIFGPGFVNILAQEDSRIEIRSNGRYVNGINIIGNCMFGDGSQVLGGVITVQDSELANGESFFFENPDERGAVLKGMGLAKGIRLKKGEVIQGFGVFDQQQRTMQSSYHPPR